MSKALNLVFGAAPQSHGSISSEICEHQGLGHPDSLCDGVAEAVSQALCAAYLQAYGEIRHHNVDKALLIGGQSSPRFGGGHVSTRMRLIVAGRADGLPRGGDVGQLVIGAARRYLASPLRVAPHLFDIESAVRTGSPNHGLAHACAPGLYGRACNHRPRSPRCRALFPVEAGSHACTTRRTAKHVRLAHQYTRQSSRRR